MTYTVFRLTKYFRQLCQQYILLLIIQPVVCILPFAPAAHKISLNQHTHIVGQRRLRDLKALQQHARAQLAAGQQVDDLDPLRI